MKFAPKHIIVGMSGGVDSSVAALLLKEQGHLVEGVFMKNWEEDDTDTYCPASADMADAQQVCDELKIPLYRVNFAAEYWQHVFTYFLAEYKAGRTPNPDIVCNKEIKFKKFLHYAKQRGADFIATGHYARSHNQADQLQLLKARDLNKDQSYFLYTLNQNQLAQSWFPLGDLPKDEVRAIASTAGFKNHNKKDSTGICFIGEKKFKQFLQEFLPAQSGNIETANGQVIGKHDGLMFYTLGQRQGLKIGGLPDMQESPWYVVHKDLKRNCLIVSQGVDNPLLFSNQLTAKDVHWINAEPDYPSTLKAKTRYRQKDQSCIIERIDEQQYQVTFEEAQRAITPGQSIVFYDDDRCLGGGIITEYNTYKN